MADVHYEVTAERRGLRALRYASRAPNATEIGNNQSRSRNRGPASVSHGQYVTTPSINTITTR